MVLFIRIHDWHEIAYVVELTYRKGRLTDVDKKTCGCSFDYQSPMMIVIVSDEMAW